MAETWSRPPLPARTQHVASSTTLLVRRLPAGALGRALPVLALAGDPASVGTADIGGAVYVLVDVGAASDEEPLAAALASVPSTARDVVLVALAVVPSWRGQGLGGRLLAEVVDDLRADGVLAVWAPTGVSGAGAGADAACRRLFERRGFRPADAPPGWSSGTATEWVSLEL